MANGKSLFVSNSLNHRCPDSFAWALRSTCLSTSRATAWPPVSSCPQGSAYPLPPLVERGAPLALQAEVQVRPESPTRTRTRTGTRTGTGSPDIDVGTRRATTLETGHLAPRRGLGMSPRVLEIRRVGRALVFPAGLHLSVLARSVQTCCCGAI